MVEFTIEQVNEFIKEEGLHQAVVIKFSYGKPDLQEVRRIFASQFDIQGNCNVGQLEFRHILIRFDLYNDYVHFLSKSTGYLKSKGEEFFFRTFPWSLGFNPKEETSMAVVWISLPGLPPNFFAKRSLMSIASAVGKVLAVDKATQDRTRPSAARVKVIIDLLDKHPKKVKLQIFDRITGKTVVFYQEIVYDNLPRYCTYCKHQGHDEKSCRILKKHAETEVRTEEVPGAAPVHFLIEEDGPGIEKLQGDARDYLLAKRAGQSVNAVAENEGKQGVDAAKDNVVGQQVLEIEGRKEIGNRLGNDTTVGDGSKIANGPMNYPRDIPATTALVRISSVVNPIVEHYDMLASAATTLSVGGGSKSPNESVKVIETFKKNKIDPVSNEVLQKFQQHVEKAKKNLDDLKGNADRAESVQIDANDRVSAGAPKGSATAPGQFQNVTGAYGSQIGNDRDNTSACELFGKATVVTPTAIALNTEVNVAAGVEKVNHVDVMELETAASTGYKVNVQTTQLQVSTGMEQAAPGIVNPTVSLNKAVDFSMTKFVDRGANIHEKGTIDWSVVSPSKKAATDRAKQEDAPIHVTCANSFDALLLEQHHSENDDGTKLALVCQDIESVLEKTSSPGNTKWQLNSKHKDDRQKKQTTGILTIIGGQAESSKLMEMGANSSSNAGVDKNLKQQTTLHSAINPTLHFSSPQVEKIIKDSQVEMMLYANPIFKQPLVTLNTSVYDIPSQSCESIGEHGGESGQHAISTGNNNEVIQTKMREMVINSKLWKDQREYDDEEGWGDGNAGFSSEEDDQEFDQDSAGEDIDAPVKPNFQGISAASKNNLICHALATQATSPSNKLNHNAPAFVPKFTANTEATNLGQKSAEDNVQQQQYPSETSAGDRTATVVSKYGQNQIVTTEPLISLEERKLLDAMVSYTPLKSLNPVTLSTGTVSKSKNKMQNLGKQQNKTIVTTTQGGVALVSLDMIQNAPQSVNLGREIFEEGEEDAMLQQCRAEAARKGDLSPMHSGKGKKTHTRKNSWDDKVSDFLNVRRPPMRNAKQKQAAPTTSTRSNRSKKKS